MTFAPYPWFLRNDELNLATIGLVLVLDQFNMESLFLVAGAATWFSLGIRSGTGYFAERLKRLVVPLVFGMLVVVPPCYWVVAVHFYNYTGSFVEYYPIFWQESLLPFRDTFSPGVLWFLWYLVFYTFPLLPILLLIRRKCQHNLIPWLAGFFEKRGALFLLVIPIALVEIYSTLAITGDFLALYYPIFFIYGFFLFSEPRFQQGIEKSGPIALVGAALTMALYMLLIFPAWDKAILGPAFWNTLEGEPGTWGFIIFRVLVSFTSWFWVIGILYLAKRFLNFSNRFLQYGSDAALPYYILHSTPIAMIGLTVVQLDMDVLPKYIINTISAFVATVVLYELIKRTNVTRFLFGMRLKKKPVPEETGPVPYWRRQEE